VPDKPQTYDEYMKNLQQQYTEFMQAYYGRWNNQQLEKGRRLELRLSSSRRGSVSAQPENV
jgi:hypothetical protein